MVVKQRDKNTILYGSVMGSAAAFLETARIGQACDFDVASHAWTRSPPFNPDIYFECTLISISSRLRQKKALGLIQVALTRSRCESQ